ncbi:MAG: formylglycine-generating enzyme family protein, partial [Candidatus Hydrothermarchaeales archaeon]
MSNGENPLRLWFKIIIIVIGTIFFALFAVWLQLPKTTTLTTLAPETGLEEKPKEVEVWKENKVTGMEFVFVKGGCYEMGDTFGDSYGDEEYAHEVCVDDFWMGRYEVTQGQWRWIMGDNPSRFKNGKKYPVERVGWDDVQEFIEILNKKTGKKFRLPTEAEWEYAARSGGKKERYAGTSDEDSLYRYANFCDINCKYDWKTEGQDDGYKNTAPVGSYEPNGLGLYDMSGNVWELVQDVYNENAYSMHSRNNPVYKGDGGYRVIRGGSWYYGPPR